VGQEWEREELERRRVAALKVRGASSGVKHGRALHDFSCLLSQNLSLATRPRALLQEKEAVAAEVQAKGLLLGREQGVLSLTVRPHTTMASDRNLPP
jgi:hypothetical protein